ncbi:MAG: tetratricopeptide repeat protein [Verrucomicrobiota bacterium]|nr:tetratricopeptide repeat protein [Verrucomicrobiota bacterium]
MPTVSPSVPDPALESHLFWERHKKEILGALVVILLALAGYAGFRFYSDYQNKSAATLLSSAKTSPDFQKVITQYSGTPAGASAYIFLADEQRKEKKFADANSTLQSFIAKNPKHELVSTARMAMAANLESLGKRDEALTLYQRIAADNPQGFTAPLALIATVPLLREKNQIEEARRVCETIQTQYPMSVVTMEAQQLLKSLKTTEPPKTQVPAPVTTTAPATPPVVSTTAPAPTTAPNAAKPSIAPAAIAPPAPSNKQPAASMTPEKP